MKIAMLVSGGVDSSVALRILKDQGHDVTAFYIKIWLQDEISFLGDCPWQDDLSYVTAVCEQAGVPLQVVSLQKEYWERVVSYTIAEVKAGRTPNPDVLCNQQIKFGLFFDHIDASYEKVASGHYARVEKIEDTFHLMRSPDAVKDQTYFLAYLNQKQLSRASFPIGHLTKPQVRELARSYGLVNQDRKDSQGICFLGKIKFSDFIKQFLGEQPGSLVEYETGKILSMHKGYWYYTIGQRQGLGLAGGPWYVVAKNTVTNEVFISRNYYSDDKTRNSFKVNTCNWIISPESTQQGIQVKLRHGAALHDAEITYGNTECVVRLVDSDQGIAPGQFAVFYDNDRCLGAGVIAQEIK